MSLEERVAYWGARIDALALLVGASYGFKYAVDNAWIGPSARIACGVLAGLAMLVAAEVTRARTQKTWTQVALGAGISLLFVSAYASHAYYHLLPAAAGFTGVAGVALLGGALAILHRGEPILLLSLLGGFLAPVLLSTGQDRPVVLFGYLLLLTTLAGVAAVRVQFRTTVWLAMTGSAVLFAGWYPAHFSTSSSGAYPLLRSRWAPLAAVVLFVFQGLAVYGWARRRHLEALRPLEVMLAVLLLGHAGLAALLFDHPIVLGAALSAMGLLGALLLTREKRVKLLGIPLAGAFLALMTTVTSASHESPRALVAMLCMLGTVYAGGLLRARTSSAGPSSPLWTGLMLSVGAAIGVLAFTLLGTLHPYWFALVLALLSLAFSTLSVATHSSELMGVTLWGSLLGLMAITPWSLGAHTDKTLVWVSAAWAMVYLSTSAYDLFVRRSAPTPARLLSIAGAGLGFCMISLSQAAPGEGWLRASILATVGLVDLTIGLAILRTSGRRAATPLLGLAMALFAGAVAMGFSAATITVVWAALAALVAYLAAEAEDPLWLLGAGGLFAAVLVRLGLFDLELPERLQALYFQTHGQQGVLQAPFLLNPRAFALSASAAAMLSSAWAWGQRRGSKDFARAAALGVSVGHLVLLVLVILEARGLAFSVHALNAGSGFEALRSAISEQHEKLAMVTTLVMALYALMLIAVGFGIRERVHRYLGLGLFALTVGKLALVDIWQLSNIQKTFVLVGVGVLLFVASFLYARLGNRILNLLREGEKVSLRDG